MFTQCTECNKLHKITIEELRRHRGILHCKKCSVRFDALAQLSETPTVMPYYSTVSTNKSLLEASKKLVPSNIWGAPLLASLALLVFQVFHFEGDYFLHSQNFRAFLEKTCATLNCRLPPYRSPNELSVLQSRFSPISEQSYQLLAIFMNQSAFPQPYPNIRVIFQEFSGKPFAQRIFHPEDYLLEPSKSGHMAVGQQLEIDLQIIKPQIPIGGYTIDLI